MEEERPLFIAENSFRITVKLYYEMDEIREKIVKKSLWLYWNCYRVRMGTSKDTQEQFDLANILPLVEGLDFLTYYFSVDERDNVIITLPTNSLFLKKC
jgi:hypothetical protein